MAEDTSKDSIVVDCEAVDSEHRVQIGLTDALCTALAEEADPATVDDILERLVDYTDAHFMAEQLLMRQYAYPLYEAHEIEHDRLTEKVHGLKEQHQAGDAPLTLDAARSLRTWLVSHIKSTDHALGDYLNDQGSTHVP